MLLTGDNERAARAVGDEVGIGHVVAEVLPAGKVAAVRAPQDEGKVVAMVGDGVNDAAALVQADLGIAMGTGTDVAIEASAFTLVRGDLRLAADAIRLSRRTLGTIKGNLFLGLRLQRGGRSPRSFGLAEPDDRRCLHGPLQRLRGYQQAPPSTLPPRSLNGGPVPAASAHPHRDIT